MDQKRADKSGPNLTEDQRSTLNSVLKNYPDMIGILKEFYLFNSNQGEPAQPVEHTPDPRQGWDYVGGQDYPKDFVMPQNRFAGGGAVAGPGTSTSDSIPAKLSDGEFVFSANAVKVLGLKKLQDMMSKAEAEYTATTQPDTKEPYMIQGTREAGYGVPAIHVETWSGLPKDANYNGPMPAEGTYQGWIHDPKTDTWQPNYIYTTMPVTQQPIFDPKKEQIFQERQKQLQAAPYGFHDDGTPVTAEEAAAKRAGATTPNPIATPPEQAQAWRPLEGQAPAWGYRQAQGRTMTDYVKQYQQPDQVPTPTKDAMNGQMTQLFKKGGYVTSDVKKK